MSSSIPELCSQSKKDKVMKSLVKTIKGTKVKTKIKKVTTKTQKKPCRLCSKERASISICNNLERPNLANEIETLTGVKISHVDKQTKYMCQNCLTKLNICIEFVEMCRKNNQDLMKTIPALNVEVTIDVKTIKEELGHHDDLDSSDREFDSPMETDDNIDCEACLRIFHNLQEYRTHLPCKVPPIPKEKIKQEPEKALCDICGKQLHSIYGIKEHLKSHTDAFPFKCGQCEYKGKTRSLLTVHIRSHLPESERPFKCSQCTKSVATASALQSHMRRTHSEERPHKCDLCEKTFKCKSDVNRHLRVTHYRQETVICNMCNTSFSQRNHLRRHLWRAHKLKSQRTLPNRLPSYIQHKMATDEIVPA